MFPAEFAEAASGGLWLAKPHLLLMERAALGIAAGEIRRQLISQPPQTGKSWFWSKFFPVWLLGNYPDRRVILGSYNSSYAADWGEEARDLMEECGPEYFGVRVRPGHRSRDDWGIETLDGRALQGRMRTMGMDAGITGKPADLFIIDDPFKSWEEAKSSAHREKVWRIYTTCVNTRLQPDSAVVLTFTPWDEDDLGGRLLARQMKSWNVLRMPALAEGPVPEEIRARKRGYAALVGAPDPLGRPPGRALWPERFDEAHYAECKELDPDGFDALYMCNPHPPEGGFFQRSWFKGKVVESAPRGSKYVRYWDKASSKGRGNWTAGVLMTAAGADVYILDVARDRLEPGPRDAWIRRVAEWDGDQYENLEIWGEHAGNDHKESASNFVKNLMGFVALTEGTGNKDKASRAYPFAKYCQAGNVYLVEGDWNDPFVDELCDFRPEVRDQTDDQVDAAGGAFGKLTLARRGVSDYASTSADELAEYGEEVYA
jgi:predicted phage terminase large subunit-like protein